MSYQEENHVKAAILDWLQSNGFEAWPNHNTTTNRGGRYQRPSRHFKPGIPDIIGYLPDGKALFIEVKTETGRLSKNQKIFLDKARNNHCIAIMARSPYEVSDALGGYLGMKYNFDLV